MQNIKTSSYRDLQVWKESHKLVLSTYKISKSFPKEELFALLSQVRRAAVSITSNIAESYGRRTLRDKSHFFQMSLGSLYELESQLLIAKDLEYIIESDFLVLEENITLVSKLLHGIIKTTNNSTVL
jgi:four helix bundle protein